MRQVGQAVLGHPILEEFPEIRIGLESFPVIGNLVCRVAELAAVARRSRVRVDIQRRPFSARVMGIADVLGRPDCLTDNCILQEQSVIDDGKWAVLVHRQGEVVVKFASLLGILEQLAVSQPESHPHSVVIALKVYAVDVESDEKNIFQRYVITLCKTSHRLYSEHHLPPFGLAMA